MSSHSMNPMAPDPAHEAGCPDALRVGLIAFLFAGGCSVGPRTSGSGVVDEGPLVAGMPSVNRKLLPRQVTGVWHLDAEGERLSLRLWWDSLAGTLEGSMDAEADGALSTVDSVLFDAGAGTLSWRRALDGGADWYDTRVAEGVLVGRFAHLDSSARPGAPDYAHHISGWSDAQDRRTDRRVWDVVIDGDALARIRIDRSADTKSGFIGRMKIYASISRSAAGEEVERDLEVSGWDGTTLTFIVHDDAGGEFHGSAVIDGRLIRGSLQNAGGTNSAMAGARADVLGYGLTPQSPTKRAEWQRRVRLQLELLLMSGAPAPTDRHVEVLANHIVPTGSESLPADRDDDPRHWPERYELAELSFTSTLAGSAGGPELTRRAHGYLATPTGAAPAGGRSAVLAVNGHEGSAAQLFQPDNPIYWYGDAFARRGDIVLGLDISHRPLEDRAQLYVDYLDGDDYGNSNGVHPALKSPDMDSDWEEDGERVWDLMRALDYLRELPGVDPNRIIVTGLSMGGEVATLGAALDPRFAAAVVAGYSPDFGTMLYHGNHPCWLWQHAAIREYIDASDLQALIAPRPLLVETGRADTIFSSFSAPFAADKQVARRARVAWADHPERYLHYLHYDIHHFHAGDIDPRRTIEQGLRAPVAIAPETAWSTAWQTDEATAAVGATMFDFLDAMMK